MRNKVQDGNDTHAEQTLCNENNCSVACQLVREGQTKQHFNGMKKSTQIFFLFV